MKKAALLTIAIVLISCTLLSEEVLKFGEKITVKESTAISEILAAPDDYIDKTVRVEGTIVGVCEHKGCWIELSGDKPYEKIRIKVNDGDMVFPLTAKGQHAVVEGSLQKTELSKEQVIEQMKKHEENTGETFDPDSVKEGRVIIQIKPTGVVISDK